MHADTEVVAVYIPGPAQFYILLVTPMLQSSTFPPFPISALPPDTHTGQHY